jgi:hypothetical protein
MKPLTMKQLGAETAKDANNISLLAQASFKAELVALNWRVLGAGWRRVKREKRKAFTAALRSYRH